MIVLMNALDDYSFERGDRGAASDTSLDASPPDPRPLEGADGNSAAGGRLDASPPHPGPGGGPRAVVPVPAPVQHRITVSGFASFMLSAAFVATTGRLCANPSNDLSICDAPLVETHASIAVQRTKLCRYEVRAYRVTFSPAVTQRIKANTTSAHPTRQRTYGLTTPPMLATTVGRRRCQIIVRNYCDITMAASPSGASPTPFRTLFLVYVITLPAHNEEGLALRRLPEDHVLAKY
ncbi:hypothetical protein EVAR_17943_1 [Eumeta japonica]|uniref:Uncharacterized protein n=1 Tax=Eumeta variegata TaxID=151549 RepID=A0A4C1V083_EUMVA|nr:hypothetical protein EVAR_17943_1 [Eumeta japonica]